uniref:Failed axon connections homolog n=1 Tax=Caenorhabditis tropicalis TaxID=1561998 RepID=A0A1I7TFP2_9PELO
MPKAPKLIKTGWEQDKVYLIQFPRTGSVPSPSPFSLKLETWLRMAGIDYENVSNEFKHMSKRGQQPFIELNGEQISDSSIIIKTLAERGQGTELNTLPPKEKALEHAFYTLIEHHLIWLCVYSRSQTFKWISTDAGYGRVFIGIRAFISKAFVVPSFESKLKKKCQGQWIGTLTNEEKISELKKDIDAISTQLGKKPFLFGDEPKTIDATLFGHLGEILYTPQFTDAIKKYIETNASNLIAYMDRIKARYWPDWEESAKTLKMDTQWRQ